MPRRETYRTTRSGKAPTGGTGRTLDRIWRRRSFAFFALTRAHHAQAVGSACVALLAVAIARGASADIIAAVGLVGSILAVATFLFEAPRVARRADARAATLEKAADRLLADKPRRGLALYDTVLALTADASLARRVSDKRLLLVEQLEAEPAPPRRGRPGARKARKVPEPTLLPDATLVDPVRPPSGGIRIAEDEGPERVGPDDRYALGRELGRGGMAVVFEAHDEVLGRDVALKLLPIDLSQEKELADRFRQEARALARVSHPNIVHVYDLFEHGERLWIAMELVRGGDLADAISRRGRFPLGEALDVIEPVARGLAFAHERDIIHRDIKPMNVLLAPDGPKLTDFGLAKLAGSGVHTTVGSVMGSPQYMSPEQAAGEPTDASTDVYSLGVTFYQLVTGRAPFEGDVAQVMAQQITQDPPLPSLLWPEVGPLTEALLLEMLAKDPASRPAKMQDLLRRLASLRAEVGEVREVGIESDQ